MALSFNRFDGYQLAKYDRAGAVRLRDALFLVHPNAKDAAQQALFDQLVRGELPTPYTWETELSAIGQATYASDADRQTAVRTTWETLIGSGQLGYMALLRNLRNLLEANVSAEAMERVCATLADRFAVARSKQLPFRFLAAYREVKAVPSGHVAAVLAALEKAIVHSAVSLRGFGHANRVVVACDVSSSMQKAISPRSKVLLYDVSLVLGMLLQSRCQNVIAGMFGDVWKRISLPTGPVLRNVEEFCRREGEVGYSTNGHLVIKDLRERREVVDKVMIFTDVQLWDSTNTATRNGSPLAQEWAAYRGTVAPNARLYLFDLVGYGTVPLEVRPENGVALVAGWSAKVSDVLATLDNGGSALTEIEKIDL